MARIEYLSESEIKNLKKAPEFENDIRKEIIILLYQL